MIENNGDQLRRSGLFVKAEQERVDRLLRFAVSFVLFWMLLLFFLYERSTVLVYLLVTILVLWIIYMIASIAATCYLGWYQTESTKDSDSEIEDSVPLEDARLHPADRDAAVFPFTFRETPNRIRSCEQPVTSATQGPRSGVYDVVYVAVIYNRHIRTEGQMIVTFTPSSNGNGWDFTGHTREGIDMKEGFCNARGELYWTVQDDKRLCIYRGIMDLGSSSLYDGDFRALDETSLGPGGRIVRFQFKSSDITDSMINENSPTEVELVSLANPTVV